MSIEDLVNRFDDLVAALERIATALEGTNGKLPPSATERLVHYRGALEEIASGKTAKPHEIVARDALEGSAVREP